MFTDHVKSVGTFTQMIQDQSAALILIHSRQQDGSHLISQHRCGVVPSSEELLGFRPAARSSIMIPRGIDEGHRTPCTPDQILIVRDRTELLIWARRFPIRGGLRPK